MQISLIATPLKPSPSSDFTVSAKNANRYAKRHMLSTASVIETLLLQTMFQSAVSEQQRNFLLGWRQRPVLPDQRRQQRFHCAPHNPS